MNSTQRARRTMAAPTVLRILLINYVAPATASPPLRVACVGDSITEGFRGAFSPLSPNAYPTQLQHLLGPAYDVQNLGSSGRVMSHSGDQPYISTSQYQRLINEKWDVVVIQLGTNDAKDAAHGVANWNHDACDGRDIAVLRRSCPYWIAYEEMLRTLRSLPTTHVGSSPAVFVAIPAPVVADPPGYNINATVVNSILPWMVPAIAAANGLPDSHVIDVFGALGGRAGAPLPTHGCTLEDASEERARTGRPRALRRYAVCRFYCSESWCEGGDENGGRNIGVHPDDRGFSQIARAVAASLVDAGMPSATGQLPEDPSGASGGKGKGKGSGGEHGDTGTFLGCLRDGDAADVWPNLTHHWAAPSVGIRTIDLAIPNSETCRARCRDRGYLFAGLIWNGPVVGPAGYALTQCYCASELGALDPHKEPSRLLADYECCPTCLNYDLRPMYDPPCMPDLLSCGAWMKLSAFWLGAPSGVPAMPPPPSPAPFLNNPCAEASAPYHAMPWCDASLPLDTRAADAVSRMSLQEKFAALGTGRKEGVTNGESSWAIGSLGLHEYNWWSEASHGVASDGNTPTTNFVLPLTAAQAFNRTLWHANGQHIGREARAVMNAGRAYSTFWAPVINLASEPRWGRNLETAGEDPLVAGVYAEHFVRGMQIADEDHRHLLASACCKHYVANQMEESTVAGVTHERQEFDAKVTSRDLLDSYMPPFQACVERGNVSGLMCSYNAVNGVPTCADEWLLTTVARGEWGFDGYITTDCGAAEDVYTKHHYTRTPEEAVGALLRSGTDLDCSGGMLAKHAEAALASGDATEADVDRALQRAFKVRMRLANFEPSGLDSIDAADTLCNDYSRKLARDGASQSTVLLKNELFGQQRRLPLSADVARGTVAVIGPNANLSMALAGYYGPANTCGPKRWPNMVDAIDQHARITVTAKGVPTPASNGTAGIPDAAALAASADVTVCVLGTDLSWAREGVDAKSISLTAAQLLLVDALGDASSQPIVVVLLTATPLDLSPLLSDPRVGAIVHAGFPSVQAEGVGDVLFGVPGAAPAGRLVQTIYPAIFAEQISIFDTNLRPGPSAWPSPTCIHLGPGCPNGTNPGRTYRFYTGQAVLPFGFGLSYTSISYELLAPTPPMGVQLGPLQAALAATAAAGRTFPSASVIDRAAATPMIRFGVRVTNHGAVASDEVVLGFLVPPNAGLGGEPLQSLFAFERVHVPPGESVDVWVAPSPMAFSHVDTATGRYAPRPGTYEARFGVEETVAHGGAFVRSAPFEAVLSPSPTPPGPLTPSDGRYADPGAGAESSSTSAAAALPLKSVAGKSLYFVLIDRFARSGAAAANTTACSGNVWCGGTLAGVTSRLDYIQGMGFDCVWVSPVVGQPAGSFGSSGTGYHGYWAEDWYAIDRHFGQPSDLKALSAALHARGMCLMLDIVTNHVRPIERSTDVLAVSPFNKTTYYHTLHSAKGETFDDYAKHPASSLSAFGPGCGPGDFACKGGYDEAQVLDGWFYNLADLNQSSPFVRSELLRWVKHMVVTYDLDALRLDTAPYMPMSFLAEVQASAQVQVIGEVTASNLTYHAAFTQPKADGGGSLDGVLNFPVYYLIGQAFCGAPSVQGALFEGGSASAQEYHPSFLALARVLDAQSKAKYASLDLLGHFVDNHDTDRIATTCRGNPARVRHALAFVFLMRGVPITYAGTEQGLAGDKSNHNRYSLWAGKGYDTSAPLYRFIRKLNDARRAYLSGAGRESLPARVVAATSDTMILARGDAALLFLNNDEDAAGRVRYCLPAPLPSLSRDYQGWRDALSGETAIIEATEGCSHTYIAADGAPKLLVPRVSAADDGAATQWTLWLWGLLLLLSIIACGIVLYLCRRPAQRVAQRMHAAFRGPPRSRRANSPRGRERRLEKLSRRQQRQRLVSADSAALQSPPAVEIGSLADDVSAGAGADEETGTRETGDE